MSTTIKDVAREAGVCIATVSRAFNEPDCVSQETLKRVHSAAKRLNYLPNALAKGLITHSTQTIGVLVPDIDNLFYPCVVKGIDAACFKNNHLSILANTYDSVEREQYYIRSLGEQRIDGYIFVGTRSTDLKDSEHIIKLAKHKPVVMVYSNLSAYGVCSIVTDDVAAVSRVTKSLFEQGHQRVALFSSDVPHMTYLDKQHGYEQALEEIGRSDDAVIYRGQPYITGGYQCMERMLQEFSPETMPTAVMVISDQMALGAWRCCEDHGIRIPDEIKIVGYSGTTLMRKLLPSLQTVDQMPDKLGHLAVNMIISMKNGEYPNMKQIIFDPVLG